MEDFDFDIDNEIDVANLQDEFRNFPSILFHYAELKANVEREHDLNKANYEESKARVYLEIKGSVEKITEKHLDATIINSEVVKDAKQTMLTAKRDLDTLKNYVESLRAKKDMLIQLGADMRKEL